MKHTLVSAALLCAVCAICGSAAAAGHPLRDPFARPAPPAPPQDVAAPEAPPLQLRAVILNGSRSVANIDGDIVGAGEQVRGYSVLRIDARGVLVTRAGKQQVLTIHEKDKQ